MARQSAIINTATIRVSKCIIDKFNVDVMNLLSNTFLENIKHK